MRKNLNKFLTDEAGAVTVDWVVLTAAVVSLAATVIFAIQGGTDSVGEGVGSYLTDSSAGDM